MKTFFLDEVAVEKHLKKKGIKYSKEEVQNDFTDVENLVLQKTIPSKSKVLYIGDDVVIEENLAYCFTKEGEELIGSILAE